MPRMARIVLCGHPHHVVQRGHNRQATFANVPDYTRYLATLQEYKVEYRVKVLAWCLMTNHVHLILVPGNKEGLGKLMKRLDGRQTRHHNKLECRSGTLWEGRYKSSLVQQDSYLRACCRYIELNPVRAQMVATPEAYRWSSCRSRFGLEPATLFDEDSRDYGLYANDIAWRSQWREYLRSAVQMNETNLIRAAVQRGQLTGNDKFTDEIAGIIGRRVELRG